MAGEQDRLARLYGEMGDEHLLDMAEDMNDLTDDARIALTAELRSRGILPQQPGPDLAPIVPEVQPELEQGFGAGMPGIFPGGASMMEQTLEAAEPAAEAKHGMSRLISFYDGLELSKACGLLEDAEIEPVIEPIAGDAMSGVAPRFEIWLETGDIDQAKTLLRAKMGLFPLAEVDENDDGGDAFISDTEELVVAEFDSPTDADAAKAILTAAGIAARIDPDEDDRTVSAVVVASKDQERALELLAARMGLG